ncbi:hypothetical protein GCM10027075_34140 [Streptomyces heilongjiangensis]
MGAVEKHGAQPRSLFRGAGNCANNPTHPHPPPRSTPDLLGAPPLKRRPTCENPAPQRHPVSPPKAPRADFLVIKRFCPGTL